MRYLLFLLTLLFVDTQAVEINRVLPTGSMMPIFDESHYLIVDKREFSDIKVGEVIVYRTKTPFIVDGISYDCVVHAVWRKSSGGRVVLCKGVNNPVPDSELITEADYLGTVICWVDKDTFYSPAFNLAAESKKAPANVFDMMGEKERKIFLDGAGKGDKS